jgi:hypothetical protein
MKIKLSGEDRCAIDLVLEKQSESGTATVSEHCYGKSTGSLQKRMKRVEQLFNLIDQMPAGDPPPRLVASTLKFIDTNVHKGHPMMTETPQKQSSISHTMLQRPLQ